jgi:sn-glycerol 3-phosphate transport system substrate-binding protein
VAGYYTAPNGQMLSFPFNSSTTIFYYNKDAFKKAGLNPDVAPKTWPEVFAAAKKLKESGHSCPMTLAWQGWTQLESFSTWHNVEFATEHNGLSANGYKARMKINSPLHVKHIDNLAAAAKAGEFVYKGRASTAQASFTAGECAMIQTSSGFYGDVAKNAKFNYALAPLPYYPMSRARPEHRDRRRFAVGHGRQEGRRVQGRGQVLQFLSQTKVQAASHQRTGYLPVTMAAYDLTKSPATKEPRHRHRRDADDPQGDRQLARHPSGQLRADPYHRGRRTRTGVGRQKTGKQALDAIVSAATNCWHASSAPTK